MKITIEYNSRTYEFVNGVQAYIFDAGTINGVEDDKLFEFVKFVYWLYIKDKNPTPLGHLCDYIAAHWDEVQALEKCAILEAFYETLN